jgi:hypothetical protein
MPTPTRARTPRYKIHIPNGLTEKTDDFDAAINRGRRLSAERDGLIEVSAPDGLVAQFMNGVATPEFAHIDAAANVASVDRAKLVALLAAVGKLTVGDMRENPRCEAIWQAYKDFPRS